MNGWRAGSFQGLTSVDGHFESRALPLETVQHPQSPRTRQELSASDSTLEAKQRHMESTS